MQEETYLRLSQAERDPKGYFGLACAMKFIHLAVILFTILTS